MPLILVVDDVPFERERVATVARALGCNVVEAGTGSEALREVHRSHPDCIVSDLCMPEMDGLELLAALRSEGDHTPVINITSDRSADTRRACRKLGAIDVLPKPFKLEKLQALLRDLLGFGNRPVGTATP